MPLQCKVKTLLEGIWDQMTPHPSKDGREPLTKDKILDQAVELLDAEGPQKLSMRRLGEALGVEAMALYHHFPSKDAILDGIVARITEEAGPGLPPQSAEWKTVMMSGPAAAKRILSRHPKAAWLFFGRQYRTAESLAMLETPLKVLYGAGFRGQELADAARAIFAYTAGWMILASGEGGSWSGLSDEDIAVAPGVAPLALEYSDLLRDWGSGFEEGFSALLDGLEAARTSHGQ
jgi:AcrR family transcriptional regulator